MMFLNQLIPQLLDKENFSYGEKDTNAFFLINLLLLLCKFHIHKCKFTNQKPKFFVLMKELKQYISLIESSKNKKAIKTVTVCNQFGILR